MQLIGGRWALWHMKCALDADHLSYIQQHQSKKLRIFYVQHCHFQNIGVQISRNLFNGYVVVYLFTICVRMCLKSLFFREIVQCHSACVRVPPLFLPRALCTSHSKFFTSFKSVLTEWVRKIPALVCPCSVLVRWFSAFERNILLGGQFSFTW